MDKNMQIEEYFEQLEVIAEHCLSDGDLKQFNQALSAIEREVQVLNKVIEWFAYDEYGQSYAEFMAEHKGDAEKEVK